MPPMSDAMGMPIITAAAKRDRPGSSPSFSNKLSATAMKTAQQGTSDTTVDMAPVPTISSMSVRSADPWALVSSQ
jgi:hypothetical protein